MPGLVHGSQDLTRFYPIIATGTLVSKFVQVAQTAIDLAYLFLQDARAGRAQLILAMGAGETLLVEPDTVFYRQNGGGIVVCLGNI